MKTNTITIPSTIDDAKGTLASIDGLVTASEWQRAAIVYAFTYEAKNQYDAAVKVPQQISIRAFSRLAIIGLKSDKTVRYYRNRWQDLVNADDRFDIGPSDTIEIPDIPWREEIIDTAVLDECLSDIGRIDQFIASVKNRRLELADDAQRTKVADHLRIVSDELITLAMEFENV